ncbi:MAG: MOSC N-terminal beta barrel domain-containing protein, partial [Pseudomonadota bacterium]|nr:MOSC N-terminal beta barrel domain-containing protein [Pseudomonadota bacterium]
MTGMIINELWRFPVKGLGGAQLDSVTLAAGQHFPGDRQFAITAGHRKFADMPDGSWQKKAAFLQLMTHERLAALDCHFAGTSMTISQDGAERLSADLDSPEGAAAINGFFGDLLGGSLAGSPRLVRIGDGA